MKTPSRKSVHKPEGLILRETLLAVSALKMPDGRRACLAYRQQVGTFAAVNQPSRYVKVGIEGQSDIGLILCGGRAGQLEIKTASGRVGEAQGRWGKVVEDMGALFLVCRSVEDAVRGVCMALDIPVPKGSE